MALKDENIKVLKTKHRKTKRFIQVLTWGVLITSGILLYGWIIKDERIDSSFSLITIALALCVIILDKKHKKIKAELESRE